MSVPRPDLALTRARQVLHLRAIIRHLAAQVEREAPVLREGGEEHERAVGRLLAAAQAARNYGRRGGRRG